MGDILRFYGPTRGIIPTHESHNHITYRQRRTNLLSDDLTFYTSVNSPDLTQLAVNRIIIENTLASRSGMRAQVAVIPNAVYTLSIFEENGGGTSAVSGQVSLDSVAFAPVTGDLVSQVLSNVAPGAVFETEFVALTADVFCQFSPNSTNIGASCTYGDISLRRTG